MNIKQSDIKAFTKEAAMHLEDEMLGLHIEDVVRAIVPFLCLLYVAGVVIGERIHQLPQLIRLAQSGEWMPKSFTRLGDVVSIPFTHN